MIHLILQRVKYPHNLAGAIRAAACFGAVDVAYTGRRFEFGAKDRLPREERMRDYRSVELISTERPFDRLPAGTVPICVELTPTATPLTYFVHPDRAAYVFGPEDGGVSQSFRGLCHSVIQIPAYHCLNLAGAINVVLSHRVMTRQMLGLDPPIALKETRRGPLEIAGVEGWDGK